MKDTVDIKFRIEAPGLTLSTFGWNDLRDFLDRLVPALASMENGPTAETVLPIRIESGSAQPVLRVPRTSVDAVNKFRAGPTRSWTNEQRAKAGKVYDFLGERGAKLSCGVRTLKPVAVPSERPEWRVREATTVRGEVRRAGGQRGGVDVNLDEYGYVHCTASLALTKEIGARLYEAVELTGLMERDARTGSVVAFRVEAFRPAPESDRVRALRDLQSLLEPELGDFDPRSFLEHLRGRG